MPEGLEWHDPNADKSREAFDAMLRRVIADADQQEAIGLAAVLAELGSETDAA